MSQTKVETKENDEKVAVKEETKTPTAESKPPKAKTPTAKAKVETKEVTLPVGVKGKMSFREFRDIHKKLWAGVDMTMGTVGHTQLMRTYNSFAIMFPEKCSDIIVWGDPKSPPQSLSNDLNIPELLKDLSK